MAPQQLLSGVRPVVEVKTAGAGWAAIRQLREARGWSQRRLADIALLTELEVVLIEHNLRPDLVTDKCMRIARALGITSLESLLTQAEMTGPIDFDHFFDDWRDDWTCKTN